MRLVVLNDLTANRCCTSGQHAALPTESTTRSQLRMEQLTAHLLLMTRMPAETRLCWWLLPYVTSKAWAGDDVSGALLATAWLWRIAALRRGGAAGRHVLGSWVREACNFTTTIKCRHPYRHAALELVSFQVPVPLQLVKNNRYKHLF